MVRRVWPGWPIMAAVLLPGGNVQGQVLDSAGHGGVPDARAAPGWASSPEGVVRELYRLVTFDAGTTPDFDEVRSLFLDDAVIVLRSAPDSMRVLSVEGFVDDWLDFIARAEVEKTGFVEEIIRLKPMVFGDIAHVLVLYEASIPGWERPPQQGVDSVQLVRRQGAWRIVAITNELPSAELPVPAELSQ